MDIRVYVYEMMLNKQINKDREIFGEIMYRFNGSGKIVFFFFLICGAGKIPLHNWSQWRNCWRITLAIFYIKE